MRRIFIVLLILISLVSNSWAATGWVKTKPAGTDSPATIDTSIGENNAALDLMLSTYTMGCKVAYSSASQLTVGTGGVMVSNSAGTIRLMLANAAATTVTWADLDTGSEAASTTYYIYAIGSATTDTAFTVKISTSSTVPNGVTYYKRLGSFYNDSSSNIAQALITNDNDNSSRAVYDSGWFAVSTGTTYSKTHNLGTTKVLTIAYFSPNSDGSGYVTVLMDGNLNYNTSTYGTYMSALTTTSVSFKTLASGIFNGADASGANYYPSSGYLRVLMLALE